MIKTWSFSFETPRVVCLSLQSFQHFWQVGYPIFTKYNKHSNGICLWVNKLMEEWHVIFFKNDVKWRNNDLNLFNVEYFLIVGMLLFNLLFTSWNFDEFEPIRSERNIYIPKEELDAIICVSLLLDTILMLRWKLSCFIWKLEWFNLKRRMNQRQFMQNCHVLLV